MSRIVDKWASLCKKRIGSSSKGGIMNKRGEDLDLTE